MRRGLLLSVLLAAVIVAASALPAAAGWRNRIDRVVGDRSMGVAVRLDGELLYQRNSRQKRVPASNEKLLLSMALFDHLDPSTRLPTRAGVTSVDGDVVTGDVYLLGGGDPAVAGGAHYARGLPFKATRLRRLAKRIASTGIEKITGGVVGSTHYFSRDWFAPGWKSYFPERYVALPSALTFEGNTHRGKHISDPELRAARSLSKKLKSFGVKVSEAPSAGLPPGDLTHIAEIESQPLRVLVRYMNRSSSNFFAEMLGKRLGVARYGQPGSIAKAGSTILAWAQDHGVDLEAYDASGLSYDNRISPHGLARLLDKVEGRPWVEILRKSLPTGGQGTLEDRLHGVPVRAKTGTLTNISALSGWVLMSRPDRWAPFAILSRGIPKYKAVELEDRIVKILNRRAR